VNGAITEKYLWQGLTRLLAVYDGSENLVMRFEYADARMPYSMTRNGSTYYLTYDPVGSLRVVADVSGNVVKRIEYDSFGNVIANTNPSFEVPFGFAGGLYDRHTGLVRFGYRDYDPDIGRCTAKDPILFTGGDTDLYGYCLNDPIGMVHESGLCSKKRDKCIAEAVKVRRWCTLPAYAGQALCTSLCIFTAEGFPACAILCWKAFGGFRVTCWATFTVMLHRCYKMPCDGCS